MNGALTSILIMAILVSVVAIIWWYIHPRDKPTVEYTSEMPTWNFSYRIYQPFAVFNRANPSVSAQSDEWTFQMRACGEAIKKSNVQAIYFLHGTFVGDDPMGLVSMLKTVYPTIEKHLAAKIRRIIRRHSEFLTGDLGNYSAKYVSLFSEAIGVDIPCYLFSWSSGNHHFARLDAAVRLAQTLADQIRSKASIDGRILVYGHSHAGQVFALLAQMIEYEQFGYQFLDVLVEAGYKMTDINANLAAIRQISLDFVTFGTPVMYTWPDSGYYRLLNIVNHRGTSHNAGSLRGILHTKDGDYIQQLGILGTDLIATLPAERRHNKRLDEVFGKGRDIKQWKINLAKKMRVSPHGKTYLVNYKDHSRTLPNFAATMFGHGVYTKFDTMLFNTRLVTEYFYKHNPDD